MTSVSPPIVFLNKYENETTDSYQRTIIGQYFQAWCEGKRPRLQYSKITGLPIAVIRLENHQRRQQKRPSNNNQHASLPVIENKPTITVKESATPAIATEDQVTKDNEKEAQKQEISRKIDEFIKRKSQASSHQEKYSIEKRKKLLIYRAVDVIPMVEAAEKAGYTLSTAYEHYREFNRYVL